MVTRPKAFTARDQSQHLLVRQAASKDSSLPVVVCDRYGPVSDAAGQGRLLDHARCSESRPATVGYTPAAPSSASPGSRSQESVGWRIVLVGGAGLNRRSRHSRPEERVIAAVLWRGEGGDDVLAAGVTDVEFHGQAGAADEDRCGGVSGGGDNDFNALS